MKKAASLIRLIRPKQWTKNGFVFAALVFSGSLFDVPMLLKTFLGFVVFCLASSCVYIINDTVDREKDRAHPKKRVRPIASGAVSIPQAMILLLALLILIAIGIAYLGQYFGLIILSYLVINLAYSYKLKNEPIIDIMCIALGFVMRALSGSFLVDVGISPWLLMCTFLLALFLAINKRKSEMEAFVDEDGHKRKVLEFYSRDMLRDMSSVIDSATIMAYSLYAINSELPAFMLATVPFVVYGLFRYQLIIHTTEFAETPEIALLKDKQLLISIFIWGALCVGIIYFG